MQEKKAPVSILLFYSEDGITYLGTIDRNVFLDKMKKIISWYPDCNQNATRLVDIIPQVESFTIHSEINRTQDVPLIEYKLLTMNPHESNRVLKLQRPYSIIWAIIDQHCFETKKHGVKYIGQI